MLMVLDIGNTNIVIGIYKENKILLFDRIATLKEFEPIQYTVIISQMLALHGIERQSIDSVVISSVVPRLTKVMAKAAGRLCDGEISMFSADCCSDFKIAIDRPAELGCDLIASAYYVKHRFPLSAIIIDAGTAIKISAVDSDGTFKGVSIAPGMHISLDALIHRTSLLMDIPVSPPPHAIGTNTQDSIKSGLLLGTASMLDGMIDRFRAEIIGEVSTIVATGGAAQYLVPLMKSKPILCDTLILDGIALTKIPNLMPSERVMPTKHPL